MVTGIIILVLGEIGLLSLAGFVIFRRYGYTLAEAVEFAIIATLMTLSCVFQLAFLVGLPSLSIMAEGVLIVLAGTTIITQWPTAYQAWRIVREFVARHRVMSTLLVIVWAYLAAQAILIPPHNDDSMHHNLARVLLLQEEKTLYLKNALSYQSAFCPVGGDILHHLVLRFHTDYGIGITSFLAYLSIIFGTYAIARRYASCTMGLGTALVVASLPELIYQATSTKEDIVTAAVAVFCLVAVYRLLDRPNLPDVLLMTLGLLFGVSAKLNFIAFLVPFTLFFGSLLIHRHGVAIWRAMVLRHPIVLVVSLIPAAMFSQIWLFVNNKKYWGGWLGPPDIARFTNGDGLLGALANLVRYFFESAHFLEPLDIVFYRITNRWLAYGFMRVYEIFLFPIWENAGALYSFRILWRPHEDLSWFGPVGFLVILPAICYALLRAPLAVRVVALTLIGYALMVAWQIAWMPWNGRFFTLFFVGAGGCVAYLLQSWRERPGKIYVIYAISGLTLFYACTFNHKKPLFPSWGWAIPGETQSQFENIWAQTQWGRDRDYYNRRHFKDDRVSEFSKIVPTGARVGIKTGPQAWTYPFLLSRPDVQFVPFTDSRLCPAKMTTQGEIKELDYLLCLNVDCKTITDKLEAVQIWESIDALNSGVYRTALFRLKPEVAPTERTP